MSDVASVTLGIGAAPYQKTLAAALLREGMLRRLFSAGPDLEVQDPRPDGRLEIVRRFPVNRLATRLVGGLWRRIPTPLRPAFPSMIPARLADELRSRWIPPCSIFHGWIGFSLACIGSAKRQGAISLLENPGSHPQRWHEAGMQECRTFGVNPRDRFIAISARNARRMEREFAMCDRIVVPSSLSYRSFEEVGLAAKTVIVQTGVDTDFFSPAMTPEERPLFRACFVGRVELAKGAGYLLQAWKRLNLARAELVIVGDLKPEMSSLLRTYADSSVRMTGIIQPQELAAIYRESDVFVLPSVNEGLAQVLLEAMASGLPLVASDYSGADELITDGKEGFIVPVRDVDRLAEAILWCYQHRDDLRVMGQGARAKIESQFTLEHYNQRQIALYRSLAGMQNPTPTLP